MEPRTGAEIIANYKASHARLTSTPVRGDDPGKQLLDEVVQLRQERVQLRTLVDGLRNEISALFREIEDQKQIIKDQAQRLHDEPPQALPRIHDIIKAVSDYSGLTLAQFTSTTRRKEICYWRHIIIFLALKHTRNTYAVVGRSLGGRQHKTIQNSNMRAATRAKPEDIAAIEAVLGLGEGA